MMTYAEIQEKLLKYNSDQNTQAIREYYNKKSFLEIMSRARSETTHSAFLAWLLKGEGFTSKEDAPLMRFLDVLVKNSNGIDSPMNEAPLKTAILSRTLEYTDVRTVTEQTIKDISEIPSRDRLDIYLTASFIKPISGKKHLRIVIENKIYSDEIKADVGGSKKRQTGMDDLTKVKLESTTINKDDYKKLNQTQRYYTALEEHPKDKDYGNDTITIFVFLTPSTTRATDDHFIPVSYQDLMDYVLEPLLGDLNLDNSTKTYLQEYVNALSVPSISEFDNEMTVLAVSNKERDKLEDFWIGYKDIITEAALSNSNKSNIRPEDLVLQKFYEKNQPLFIAIYHILKDVNKEVKILKPFTTRDYTKYTLKYDKQIVKEHLGKRATVLAAAKFIIDKKLSLPKYDYSRVFFYKKDEFKKLHDNGEISQDVYENRYSEIEDTDYVICNQWGIGNWNWVEEALLKDPKFELISE